MRDFSREELIEYLKFFNPKNYADTYYESLSDKQLQAMYEDLLEVK